MILTLTFLVSKLHRKVKVILSRSGLAEIIFSFSIEINDTEVVGEHVNNIRDNKDIILLNYILRNVTINFF